MNNFTSTFCESTSKNLTSANEIIVAKFFSPQIVHKLLYQHAFMGHQDVIKPQCSTVYAAVCVADISGFTKLASSLSAEILKKHINEYFSKMLSVIHKYGGDVVKFCGDAVIIIWPVNSFATSELKSTVVLLACICSLELLEVCGNYPVQSESTLHYQQNQETFRLSLHCGISCGSLHCLIVGENEHFEFLISGEGLLDVGDALSRASTCEVVLSQAAMNHVGNILTASEVDGIYKLTSSSTSTQKFYKLSGAMGSGILPNLDCTGANAATLSGIQVPCCDYDIPDPLSTLKSAEFQSLSSPLSSIDTVNSAKTCADNYNNYVKCSHHDRTQLSTLPIDVPVAGHLHNSIGSVGRRLSSSVHLLTASFLSGKIKALSKNSDSTSNGLHSGVAVNMIPTVHRLLSKPFSTTNSLVETSILGDDTTANQSSIALPNIHAAGMFDFIFCRGSDALAQLNHFKLFIRMPDDQTMSPPQNDHFVTGLKSFIQKPALQAIQRGVLVMLSEIRNITTVFINIFGLESDFLSGNIARIQQVMSVLLTVVKRYDGFLRQFVLDDKGCVAILCFGLQGLGSPSSSCSNGNASLRDGPIIVNNSIRAVQSSLYVAKMLSSIGCMTNIGISQGLVYCGLVGALNRGEYVVMGASVNLAARLMGTDLAEIKSSSNLKIESTVNILTDSTVFKDAIGVFQFLEGPSLTLKGYSSAVFSYIVVKQNFRSQLCHRLHLLGAARLEYKQSFRDQSKRFIYEDGSIIVTATSPQLPVQQDDQVNSMIYSFSSGILAADYSNSGTSTLENASLEESNLDNPYSTTYSNQPFQKSNTGTGSGSDAALRKVHHRIQSTALVLSKTNVSPGFKSLKTKVIPDFESMASHSRKSSATSLPAIPILDRSSTLREIVQEIVMQPQIGKSIFILDPSVNATNGDSVCSIGDSFPGLGKTTMLKNFARLFNNAYTKTLPVNDDICSESCSRRLLLCDISLFRIKDNLFTAGTTSPSEFFWTINCVMKRIFDVNRSKNIGSRSQSQPGAAQGLNDADELSTDVSSGSKRGKSLFRKSVHKMLSISSNLKSPGKNEKSSSSGGMASTTQVSLLQQWLLELARDWTLGDIFESQDLSKILGHALSVNLNSSIDQLIPYLFGKSIEFDCLVSDVKECEKSSFQTLLLCIIYAASLFLALRKSGTTLPFILLLDNLHLSDLPSVWIVFKVSRLLHRSSGVLIVSSMQSFLDSILVQQLNEDHLIHDVKKMIQELEPPSHSRIIRLQPFTLLDIDCMIQLVCRNLQNLCRVIQSIHNYSSKSLDNGDDYDVEDYSVASITKWLSKDIYEKHQSGIPYNIVRSIQCLKLGIDEYVRERECISSDVSIKNGREGFVFEFDQLDIFDQTVLKISSVIGLRFDESTLTHVCNGMGILGDDVTSRMDRYSNSRIISIELTYSLQRLVENQFFCVEAAREKCYIFNDAELHRIIYSLMLLSQREELHSVIASYYEMRFRHDFLRWESEISRHYLSSNNLSRKLACLRIDATRAVSEHRANDAITILSNILKVSVGLDEWQILSLLVSPNESGGNKDHTLPHQPVIDGSPNETTVTPAPGCNGCFEVSLFEILSPDGQLSSLQNQKRNENYWYTFFEDSIKHTDLLCDVATALAEIGILRFKLQYFGGEQLIALSLRILGVRVDQKLSINAINLPEKFSLVKLKSPNYMKKFRSIFCFPFDSNKHAKVATSDVIDDSIFDIKLKTKRSRNVLINVAHKVHIPVHLCSIGPLRNLSLECIEQLAYVAHLQGKREFVEDLVIAALNNCYSIQYPRFQYLSRLTNVLDDEWFSIFRGVKGFQHQTYSVESCSDSDEFLLNRLLGLLSMSLKEAGKVSLQHIVRLLNKRQIIKDQNNRRRPKVPLIFILEKIQENSDLT